MYKLGNDIVLAIIYVDNALFCSPSKSLGKKIKATGFFLGNKQINSKQRGFSRQLLLPPWIEHY